MLHRVSAKKGRARLKMDFRAIWSRPASVVLLTLLAQSALWSVPSFAETEKKLVEVIYPVQGLVPYRERRPSHQMTFNFQYENFLPQGFVSPTVGTSFNQTYSEVAAPILSGSIGWKYNVSVAGLELAAFYGNGGLISVQGGDKVSLDVSKYGLKFGAYLDTIMREPYVVPYGALQLQMWNISEVNNTNKYSHTTGYALGYQVGALVQLNWVESDAALVALNESGLTNTYLDFFLQSYGAPTDAADPNLASEFNWGVGFRLEY